ncbi:AAA family ATPase [Georgenia ruanii]|uniref:AAA family ATPase n=1 Tax=Georgenia ruanii TaxID=348442 RepID=A0A7J9URP6_9MICO|nr:AAA family ATPase [Georgenia ruanii]
MRHFRNIIDTGSINVETDVTCLVGMNEAGKTAVLTALHRLKPVDGSTFVTQHDYPRWMLAKDRRADIIGDVRPIEAVFTLDDAEKEMIAQEFGEGVLTHDEVAVYRKYDDVTQWWDVPASEPNAVEALVQRLDLPEDIAVAVGEARTFDDLQARVRDLADEGDADAGDPDEGEVREGAQDRKEALARVTNAVADLVGDATLDKAISNMLSAYLPHFFYFGEYSVLDGRIDLLRLAQEQPQETGSTSDQTARSLLALAETTPQALSSDNYEDRRAELEAVSNDLTEQVFEYWKQNPSLRVRFDIDRTIENDPQGHARVTKNILDIRVEDTRHHFTNNFSQRSSGFRWFFSFLAAFTEFESRNDNLVILLDEPGLTLHGRAQADLLRFINERLAAVAPVIYTTHSPFMVETGNLRRIRIVEDQGPKVGSVVSQEALTVDADSLFPLQAALGYDVAQHLFIGSHNLLVEGPSDFLYLDLISRHLGNQGRSRLDERLRILPAGSSSNIPAFVALIGRELEVTVLVDSGTEGTNRLEAAMEAGRIQQNRLIRVGDIIDAKHADIEDLFTVEDYLPLYNTAFGRRVKEENLGGGDRIVHRLQQLHGKFDHYKPAEVLLRDPKRIDGLSETTLDNFEALIQRMNRVLE